MRFDWWTFALQTINFVILVWLLNRFLYKPVLGLIDVRRQQIDKQFANAESAGQAAAEKLKQVEDERSNILAERERLIKAAAQEAAEAARVRVAQAEAKVESMMDDARKTLAREREQTKVELHEFALGLAGDLARKLVSELPVEKRAEAWLERVDRYFEGLPPPERSALVAQAVSGEPVEVTSAVPLPPEAVAAWRERLRRILGDETVCTFSVDPQLIAGVELHFPEAVLRFSLRDAIDRLREEVQGRGESAE